MKFTVLSLVAAASFGLASQSQAGGQEWSVNQVMREVAIHQAQVDALNLIDWQVGDFQKIAIEMIFGKGAGTKEVTKEDTAQGAVWLVQNIAILGQNQKTESLIRRADGKLLELIVNGKKEDPNADGGKVEIIEQKETSITVPAGTFECMYVKAKITQQGQTQDVELWANPIDVNIDGMLKVEVQSSFGPVTLLLEQFGKKL
jgi:hypothetical protein